MLVLILKLQTVGDLKEDSNPSGCIVWWSPEYSLVSY